MTPTILIAGQSSGVGKTTITLGVIGALRRRGLRIQSFKCGPDYIDPTYHALASGRPCRNLDTWMLTPEQMLDSFARANRDADIAVVEGVMGLFDGSSYTDELGSSAHVAKLLGCPVLLILDIGKMARSAGALALGYAQFDPEVPLAGFLLNRAGSSAHANGCRDAIAAHSDLPVLGWVSKHANVHIPERHLGLIPTNERQGLDDLIQSAADAIEENVDLDRLIEIAQNTSLPQEVTSAPPHLITPSLGHPIIAVARDEAFSFHYPDNLELLTAAGADIAFFSPLHDRELPPNTDGLYLGGGFPEVYAAQLSQNEALLDAIQRAWQVGCPIFAECGGLMLLTEAMTDLDGTRWPLTGIIPGQTVMQQRLAGLGYRVATASRDNLLMAAGETVRGHEFHYSTWQVAPEQLNGRYAWQMRRRAPDADCRPDGYCHDKVLASYLHIHFGQNPALAAQFVATCAGDK